MKFSEFFFQRFLVVGAASTMLLCFPVVAKDAAKKLPDLVKICKKECPEAKNNNEAHECAEDRAKDAKGEEFKKSKCWIENEKYEVMVKG